MKTAQEIIDKYYPAHDDESKALRALLLHHSRQVADKAMKALHRHPELRLDADLVERAARLHDIGIYLTDAPGIHCHGTQPYLLHGYLGAQLMRNEGDERVARICERHTGTGLTAADIAHHQLPLPPGNYCPETLEEQLVCYADKFFSKSHPERERSVEQTVESLKKFGDCCVDKFLEWEQLFG